MQTRRSLRPLPLLIALAAACGGEPVQLAEKAEKLEVQAPKAPEVVHMTIDSASSKLDFDMEAPIEKIRGKVPPSAMTGEVWIDPVDLSKSRGLVHLDITDLELFQRKAPEPGKEFGEEVKEEKQNEHARGWLEISPDTPPEEMKKNAKIEFALSKLTDISANDLTKLTGPERKVTLTASGDFLLHQRKAPKSVKLEVTFRYDGDKLKEVHVKNLEPLSIGLEEYDVRPREGFGKLAKSTLEVLSPKVAKTAEVNLEFTAKAAP